MVLCSDSNRNRTMVGAVDVGVDGGTFNAFDKFGGDEEVVEAPADVPVARAGEEVPIGICVFHIWMEMAEGVHIACTYDLIYPGAFFGEKAGIFFIFFRPREVDLLVGGVHVAAKDDRLLLAQLLGEREKSIVEAELVVQPYGTLAGIGEVDVDEPEVVVFSAHQPPLLVELFDAHAVDHFERLDF